MKRFVKVCVGSTALALGVAIAPLAAAAGSAAHAATSTTRAGHSLTSRHVTIPAPRAVNARAVSRMATVRRGGHSAPLRYFNPSLVASQRAAAAATGGRRSGVVSLGAKPSSLRAVTPPSTLADFPTMNLATQVGKFGSDQAVQPPDTQIAAGPNNVVETVNDSLSVWPKTGGSPTLVVDLTAFFSVPAGQFFTDPRLMYDAQSGHWFLSGWSFNATLTTTQTYLAVSKTSDPTGNWFFTTVNSSTASELTDQPMIGVCSDKLVMAWNDFTNGTTTTFNGSFILVLQKSALIAGTAPAGTGFVDTDFRVVPAQSLSPTTTCWATANDADTALGGSSTSPTIGVISFTGPAASAAANESNPTIRATSPPPAPAQPGGTVDAATANDDRFLSAVWQDNALWTTGTETCTPPTDTTVRNCMRLIEVNTTTAASPSVTQDEDLGTVGVDQYYPAVSLSYTGDLFVSYTSSSSTQDPTADAVVSPSVSGTAFSSPITIEAGSAAYNGTRWGDYSAAAPDPSQPGAVWAAAEYAPSDAATSGHWATGAAELTLASTPAVAVGAEGTDGQLWAQAPQLNSGWQPLGGRIIAAPAVVAAPNQDGTTKAEPLFIGTGTDETLWIRSASVDWQQIGVARCLGGAGAVITGSTLTVACRGTDNALWYNTATVPPTGLPTFSGSWNSLGGVLSAGPAIAPVGGTVTFFVRGSNGQVFTRTVAAGYVSTPFFCTGQPAAAQGSSAETIFACNAGGALWESVNGGAGFSPAVSLGGALIGGPGVAPTSLVPDLFAEGTDHAVWMRTPAGWSSLGGGVVGGVGAAALN